DCRRSYVHAVTCWRMHVLSRRSTATLRVPGSCNATLGVLRAERSASRGARRSRLRRKELLYSPDVLDAEESDVAVHRPALAPLRRLSLEDQVAAAARTFAPYDSRQTFAFERLDGRPPQRDLDQDGAPVGHRVERALRNPPRAQRRE